MWFRRDLRVEDNPALHAAANSGHPVIPLFVWHVDEQDPWAPGMGSQRRLRESLRRLASDLEAMGSRLVLREGPPDAVFDELLSEIDVAAVYWNRRLEPYERQIETKLTERLESRGVDVESFNGNLLIDPEGFFNKSGEPYRVFTPFWKACREAFSPRGPALPRHHLAAPDYWPPSRLAGDGARLQGAGGEGNSGAGEATSRREMQTLDERLRDIVPDYEKLRDRPDHDGTSRLSDRLHFGEVSPRQVRHVAERRGRSGADDSAEAFVRQLGWREFGHYLLYHYPETTDRPMRREFENFPWKEDPSAADAWKTGTTGYPFVDAGMRQLARTGWMHNRVRMVVASFLVKHLLQPWQIGARHFWEHLVDADLANNTLGWQWVAGCGADAAPYFRIFNPVLQGEKFDPAGKYVREWIPEIADLPARWIHKPWQAPKKALEEAGVRLGTDYPRPIVDHRWARTRALRAYEASKK